MKTTLVLFFILCISSLFAQEDQSYIAHYSLQTDTIQQWNGKSKFILGYDKAGFYSKTYLEALGMTAVGYVDIESGYNYVISMVDGSSTPMMMVLDREQSEQLRAYRTPLDTILFNGNETIFVQDSRTQLKMKSSKTATLLGLKMPKYQYGQSVFLPEQIQLIKDGHLMQSLHLVHLELIEEGSIDMFEGVDKMPTEISEGLKLQMLNLLDQETPNQND